MEHNTDTNISNIFDLLKSKGIDKKFIKDVLLPSWWDESILNSKAGFLQTLSIISKNLNISIKDLLSNSSDFHIASDFPIRFKQNRSYNNLTTDFFPQSLASKINKIINHTFEKEVTININTPSELRAFFFENYSEINLNNLLDFLWSNGVPVIYISKFPKGVNKLDGMIFKLDKRPVILVSSKRKHDAWLIFIIAHELGHLMLNHINDSGNIIFDHEIEQSDIGEEEDANNFALDFLLGNKNDNIIDSNLSTAFKLVNIIKPLSVSLKIDPGVIALFFAKSNNKFPLASNALNTMYPEADASIKVISYMQSQLNLENLNEEDLEYFEAITGLLEE